MCICPKVRPFILFGKKLNYPKASLTSLSLSLSLSQFFRTWTSGLVDSACALASVTASSYGNCSYDYFFFLFNTPLLKSLEAKTFHPYLCQRTFSQLLLISSDVRAFLGLLILRMQHALFPSSARNLHMETAVSLHVRLTFTVEQYCLPFPFVS